MKKSWLVLVAFLLTACAPRFQPISKLEANRQRWQAHHVAHYSFSAQVNCLCGAIRQPYTFEVKDGEVVSALDRSGAPVSEADINAPPDAVQWLADLAPLDNLFDFIQKAETDANQVNVLYDPELGYPTYIGVDWMSGETGDDIAIRIVDFKILP